MIPETWTLEDCVSKLDAWQAEREARRKRIGRYASFSAASATLGLIGSSLGSGPRWYNWLSFGMCLGFAAFERLGREAERRLDSLAEQERRLLLALARDGR